jgi:hypothetical protein
MTIESLLNKIRTQPEQLEFAEIMDLIESEYSFTPVAFSNGEISNEANTNNGSCKIFSFGLLHQLTEIETLACFGAYYRDDVLKHPEGSDHGNIRNFMKTGWAGIRFESDALKLKS